MKKRLCIFSLCLSLMITACSSPEATGDSSVSNQDEITCSTTVTEVSTDTVYMSETEEECTETSTETIYNEELDYERMYRPVLNETYYILVYGFDEYEVMPEGANGLWDYGELGINNIGYTFIDLNGDGIKELIIGFDFILDIYTLVDNEPYLVQEGWSRSALYLLDDGCIYLEGSNGAAYAVRKCLKMLPGETVLSVIEMYYSGEGYDDNGLRYFYNDTGSFNWSFPSEEEISKDEFYNWENVKHGHIVNLDYTLFRDYEYAE